MPSDSCVSRVRDHLPGLFEDRGRGAAASLGAAFHEFAGYVADHPALATLNLSLGGVIAYHDSCHARRSLGLTETVLGLFASIKGLEVRRLRFEAECCGFGGVFSAAQPETSAAIRAAKVEDIEATGARVVVSTDLSCLSHIATGLPGGNGTIETWTVSELLAKALR